MDVCAKNVKDPLIYFFPLIFYPGLEAQLKPIEEQFMDSGSWFWNYKIKSTHVQLEMVEL